jgi:hypothetical protein
LKTVSVLALNAPVFGLECAFLRFCAFKAENGRIQGRVLTGTQALREYCSDATTFNSVTVGPWA